MYNSTEIAEKIKQLCAEKNITVSNLLESCGLSKNIIYSMSKGSYPQIDNLVKIADHLEVSLDYLVGRTQENTYNNQITTYDIIKGLFIGLSHIKGVTINTTVAQKDVFGDILDTQIVIENTVASKFLKEFSQVYSILSDVTYPQYIKDGLIKTMIDKYSNIELSEDGMIEDNRFVPF